MSEQPCQQQLTALTATMIILTVEVTKLTASVSRLSGVVEAVGTVAGAGGVGGATGSGRTATPPPPTTNINPELRRSEQLRGAAIRQLGAFLNNTPTFLYNQTIGVELLEILGEIRGLPLSADII